MFGGDIIKEKTELEKIREKEWERLKGGVEFVVINITPAGIVESRFKDLDEVMHKIKLDLITMAKYLDKAGITEIFARKLEEVV